MRLSTGTRRDFLERAATAADDARSELDKDWRTGSPARGHALATLALAYVALAEAVKP